MDAQQVIAKFRQEYPGKSIICLPGNTPTEIICEVSPSSENRTFSRAVVAIQSSAPHYHNLARETYKVLSGELDLFVEGEMHKLSKGDEYTVQPKEIHFAKGEFTIVQVDSSPGWTSKDHILVNL